MLDVQPRLFFLHSWAKNDALRLALGLNSALENAAQLDLKARSRLMAPAISGSSAAKPEWPSVRQSPPPYRSRGGSCRYAPRLAHLSHVRRALAKAKQRGAKLGNPNVGKMVSEATAACDAVLKPILQEMWEMPLRDIAAELTARNIPTPRGGDAWSPMTVMRVMKRLGIAGQ